MKMLLVSPHVDKENLFKPYYYEKNDSGVTHIISIESPNIVPCIGARINFGFVPYPKVDEVIFDYEQELILVMTR
jgi:hypothetical protein